MFENDDIFFCREFEHALDSQCRVSLPSDWRGGEGEPHLVLFPGRNRDLLLFPYSMFREYFMKARSSAMANPAVQNALAQLGRVVRDIRPDKQGRIKLEREMLNSIGVSNQLKMIGAITHIKLCAPDNFEAASPDDAGGFLDEIQQLNDTQSAGMESILNILSGGK